MVEKGSTATLRSTATLAHGGASTPVDVCKAAGSPWPLPWPVPTAWMRMLVDSTKPHKPAVQQNAEMHQKLHLAMVALPISVCCFGVCSWSERKGPVPKPDCNWAAQVGCAARGASLARILMMAPTCLLQQWRHPNGSLVPFTSTNPPHSPSPRPRFPLATGLRNKRAGLTNLGVATISNLPSAGF